jgi:nitrate/TMAO reductase-like tetraheme cytochrome c subunit
MEVADIFRIATGVFSLVGVALCLWVARVNFEKVPAERKVRLGFATLSGVAFFKLLALAALFAAPAATVAVANYHTIEGVHGAESCNRCHVMTPMVTDLRDAESGTLAARHYKNGWIPKDQCYQCHSDYGLAGDMRAKMEGYRHLARYTTRTYQEPIKFRGVFRNDNCLKCHAGTPKFEAGPNHAALAPRLADSTLSCLNCHGRAHPTREQRTPGSNDYQRLVGDGE